MRSFLFLLIGFTAITSWASDCTLLSSSGTVCTIDVLNLHPTQLAVGMREVLGIQADLERKSVLEREKKLAKEAAPVVIGPDTYFYLLDKHHLARAAWQAGIKQLSVKVQENWLRLSADDFWKQMQKRGYVYLFDEFGHGPMKVTDLPESVISLADDWYRSVAGEVERSGGFDDVSTFYFQFVWANFFRSRITRKAGDVGFAAAVKAGLALASTSEAETLPGYQGAAGDQKATQP